MHYDIITCGSATIDAFVTTEQEPIIKKAKKKGEELIAYPLGEKILVKNILFESGGGGTNTAVAFARLGLKTGFLGTIGKDDNGAHILALLRKENITFTGTQQGATGYSMILDAIHRDRTIFAYKGANDSFTFRTLPKTKWFYATSMTGKSFESLKKAFKHYKSEGVKTAFNPSYYQAAKGKNYLLPILKHTDVLILNKEEAMALLGEELTITHATNALRSLGPKMAVITDGARGAWASNGTVYHVFPKQVKILETTGAGDAFGSSFIAGLIMNLSLEESMRLGMINAESVIAHYGAKNILLTKKEALARLKKDKRACLQV